MESHFGTDLGNSKLSWYSLDYWIHTLAVNQLSDKICGVTQNSDMWQ